MPGNAWCSAAAAAAAGWPRAGAKRQSCLRVGTLACRRESEGRQISFGHLLGEQRPPVWPDVLNALPENELLEIAAELGVTTVTEPVAGLGLEDRCFMGVPCSE